ncbi:MAG TPA: hypothetical protein PLX31_13045 [Gemmatimonadaceae bacterium]|nr:hypothetical protein [Gemmatimonadota bacterium]HNV75747.1 hypothetical protein [Gemmatimonadaceae bacterium]HPV75823.1 hypothetical protein [Gemmatimonadaceae bacterium]
MLVGIVLIAAGAFVLLRGGTFTSRRDVLDLGGVKVTAEEQHPIAPWVAGAALLGGVALVVSGLRRKA